MSSQDFFKGLFLTDDLFRYTSMVSPFLDNLPLFTSRHNTFDTIH